MFNYLLTYFCRNDGSEADEEEEGGEGDQSAVEMKPRDAFLEDPAVLRQRREQRWTTQQQQRSARSHGGGASRSGNDYTIFNFSKINQILLDFDFSCKVI